MSGSPAYIYFLIEFQSTVERFMAVRVLQYVLSFYQDLLKQKKLKHLPPVFPIVLYSGKRKWTAPLNLEELVQTPLDTVKPYIPRFTYYKIAENEFSREGLSKLDSLVAKMFMLETSDVTNLPDTVAGVMKVLKTEVNPILRRDFGVWIRGMLRKKKIDLDVGELNEMEVKPMLLETLDKFEKDTLKQGRREGRRTGERTGQRKGQRKGRLEALRGTLTEGLEAKYGASGAQLKDRVALIEDAARLQKLVVAFALAPTLADFLREFDLQPPVE